MLSRVRRWRLSSHRIAKGTAIAALGTASVLTYAAEPARPAPLKSGIEFASSDVRSLQADDFANPGMLWVTRGEKLWGTSPARGSKSCRDCHANAQSTMKGVATRYPLVDPGSARLISIEGRINVCRVRHQDVEPLVLESEELLALSTYITHQSRGMPVHVTLNAQNQAFFERGKARYFRRIGQMNLACTHCHDQHRGRALLAQPISQGHGNAYPTYRLEWQGVGSLERRLRACFFGVRAEMPRYGDQALLELQLYLAWRATGLGVETPGVRR